MIDNYGRDINYLRVSVTKRCNLNCSYCGAKKTSELIPLCHNIPIESVEITFENNGEDELYIYCTGKCSYKTGIEMEALTGASVAALTIYDMCKAIDKRMEISDIHLEYKAGGKSGEFVR